jgi:hypothetical protein
MDVALPAWGIVIVPVAIVEWSFLHDPTSYAAMARLPLSKGALVKRTIVLWLDNFAPWRWAFARPEWYVRPHAVISVMWMVAGSLFAASLFLMRVRTKDDVAGSEDGACSVYLAVLFAVMALVANAAYAMVWFSELQLPHAHSVAHLGGIHYTAAVGSSRGHTTFALSASAAIFRP